MMSMRSKRKLKVDLALIARHSAAVFAIACAIIWHISTLAADTPKKALSVVTTIKPVHSLVATVMQGLGEPTLLIEGVQSPHHYALKPSEAEAIHNADLLVRMSPKVETFTQKLVSALPGSVSILTLDTVTGLTRLGARSPHTHQHTNPGSTPQASENQPDPNEEYDAHMWLDPENGERMLHAIAAALAKQAPQHAEHFNKNAELAASKLQSLQAELLQTLEGVKNKPFVVYHDAFQYFEHRFGLRDLGAVSLQPDVPPSAKQISRMRALISSNNVGCVFSDPQFDTRRLANVIEGTETQIAVLDPLGTTIEKGPAAYETLLRNLADGFIACLSGS
jgi:zinc transport system substrate-binding protein